MPEDDKGHLFGGSIDRSKLEEMKAAAGDDPERQRVVAEVQAQVDAVAESDARAERARAEAAGETKSAREAKAERAESEKSEKQDAERQQREADAKRQQAEQAEVQQLQAQAEQAGVTVDKRWGAERLRQEITSAQSAKQKKG